VILGLSQHDDCAEIVVRDTGVGIGAADLPHIFERFYRADPARGRDPGGTGLGLPIARWIVEQHGGSIATQSEPGQGTVVTVRLPCVM
jgi:two-component system, OmpR family, sensor kinase